MKPRRYEALLLLDPELPQEEFDQVIQKLTGIIDTMGGKVVHMDDWGRKRLAYPVMKKMYGHYVILDFMGSSELHAEFERIIGIEERIYKNMTLVLDKNFSEEKYQAVIEHLQAEKARLEAEKAQREAERARREAEMGDKEESDDDEETGGYYKKSDSGSYDDDDDSSDYSDDDDED